MSSEGLARRVSLLALRSICGRDHISINPQCALFCVMRSSWSLPSEHLQVQVHAQMSSTALSTNTTMFMMLPHRFLLCYLFLITTFSQALSNRPLGSRNERLSSRQSGPYNVTWPDSSVTWFTGQTYNVTWLALYYLLYTLSAYSHCPRF